MTADTKTGAPVFRVIDAMDAPHFGQILKLRLISGRTPTLKEIKGSLLRGSSPDGEEGSVTVVTFSMIGGKPSQARFGRTGRIDLVALPEPLDSTSKVAMQWTLTGPA